MARGARVIANSSFTARHVAASYPEARPRLVTIPRGVDLALFDPGLVGADRVAALRRSGLKTEPAFARALELDGDPYERLWTLSWREDDDLRAVLAAAGHTRSV